VAEGADRDGAEDYWVGEVILHSRLWRGKRQQAAAVQGGQATERGIVA